MKTVSLMPVKRRQHCVSWTCLLSVLEQQQENAMRSRFFPSSAESFALYSIYSQSEYLFNQNNGSLHIDRSQEYFWKHIYRVRMQGPGICVVPFPLRTLPHSPCNLKLVHGFAMKIMIHGNVHASRNIQCIWILLPMLPESWPAAALPLLFSGSAKRISLLFTWLHFTKAAAPIQSSRTRFGTLTSVKNLNWESLICRSQLLRRYICYINSVYTLIRRVKLDRHSCNLYRKESYLNNPFKRHQIIYHTPAFSAWSTDTRTDPFNRNHDDSALCKNTVASEPICILQGCEFEYAYS